MEVFEVLPEAWTPRRKKEQKGWKERKKLKPELRQSLLANRRREALRPLFHTISPNGPGHRDSIGKHRKAMNQMMGESPSRSAIPTNLVERFAATLNLKTINTSLIANTKPHVCFRLAKERGHETKAARLMA
ncbi:hypothetical protein H5410_060821 [Solanum commersonii]|uniref:Uncharacterized protein n=1 Tax=Solanum commersonii TaxID=4109 RepID=A0A9J5W6T5_SOLCO|nr:hypothetical protein H5410_060821 [Solanum commersonii]